MNDSYCELLHVNNEWNKKKQLKDRDYAYYRREAEVVVTESISRVPLISNKLISFHVPFS